VGDVGPDHPGDGKAGGGIASAYVAPVDDGTEPAVGHQQVERVKVAVDPHGWAGPRWCGDEAIEHGRHRSVSTRSARTFRAAVKRRAIGKWTHGEG
jgi:hypothetical protein